MSADTLLRFAEVAVVPIVVALITAVASAYRVVKTQRKDVDALRRENTVQHDRSSDLLSHLSRQVGGIDGKIDRIDGRVDNLQLWAADHEKQHLTESRESTGGTL